MRILYLSPTRFPTERAHGAQIAHMCSALASLGRKVTLLAPYRVGNPIRNDPFEYYGLPRSFKIKHVFCMPWGVASKLGFWSNFVAYNIHALLYVLFKKVDVIYARDEFVLSLISLFVDKEKIIWESHEAKFNFAARSLLRRGVRCVSISEGIKAFYVEKGIDPKQILVAHDGIDEAFFDEVESKEEARKRLGIDSERLVAMYIGGLDEWKGVETFFEASEHNDSAAFIVVGGREDEINLYRDRHPKVIFLGSRPYTELKDNQQAADVLVVPNTSKNKLSSEYTSPLKLFAHMASNVPLVVSDTLSVSSVVSGEQVTFFRADHPEDLARQIKLVLENIPESERKAKNAYELAKGYTWSKRAQKITYFAELNRQHS